MALKRPLYQPPDEPPRKKQATLIEAFPPVPARETDVDADRHPDWTVPCECGRQVELRYSRKQNANEGRAFYGCICGTFSWADTFTRGDILKKKWNFGKGTWKNPTDGTQTIRAWAAKLLPPRTDGRKWTMQEARAVYIATIAVLAKDLAEMEAIIGTDDFEERTDEARANLYANLPGVDE